MRPKECEITEGNPEDVFVNEVVGCVLPPSKDGLLFSYQLQTGTSLGLSGYPVGSPLNRNQDGHQLPLTF